MFTYPCLLKHLRKVFGTRKFVRNASDIYPGLKEPMDNQQPSRLGETLRVPDDAVHRLNGSG